MIGSARANLGMELPTAIALSPEAELDLELSQLARLEAGCRLPRPIKMNECPQFLQRDAQGFHRLRSNFAVRSQSLRQLEGNHRSTCMWTKLAVRRTGGKSLSD